MTAICPGGGASRIKAGVQDTLVYTGGAAGLIGLIPELTWLQGAGILLGALAYDLTTICPNDPPSPVTFTAAEYLAFASSNVSSADYTSFISKLQQTVDRILWFQFCECTGGSTPAYSSPPAAPAGITVLPGGNGAQICQSFITPKVRSTATRTPIIGPFQLAPGGSLVLKTTAFDTVGSGTSNRWEVWRNTTSPLFSGASFAGPSVDAGNGASGVSSSFGVVQAAYYWLVLWDNGTHVWGDSSAELDIYCVQSSSAGCCPPDQDLSEAIAAIKETVELIQRQAVPFAFIEGDSHDVSGTGSVAVSDLIGARLTLTDTPDRVGVSVANPDILFDVGWWSIETDMGVVQERRVRHSSNVWLPRDMGVITTIGYALTPGVTATLVELVREAS